LRSASPLQLPQFEEPPRQRGENNDGHASHRKGAGACAVEQA
jgi:hypothetical protein